VLLTGLYLHVGPFAMRVVKDLDQQIAALDEADPTDATLAEQATLA